MMCDRLIIRKTWRLNFTYKDLNSIGRLLHRNIQLGILKIDGDVLFCGDRWNNIKKEQRKQYLKNAYRIGLPVHAKGW